MKRLLAAVFFLNLHPLAVQANITGRVTLVGEPLYPDAVIQGVTDKHCQTHGEIKTEDWKISTDRGLGDVVVSIENPPPSTASTPGKITITQEGCRYLPHVSALQAGGSAVITNGDDTLHNVRGIVYLGRGKASQPIFNTGQPIKGMATTQSFPKAGIFRLNCDVHPWMESWILVFAHPWFAVSDADGKFSLPAGLPDGEYTLQAWHNRFKNPLTQKFTVTGGNAEANLTFDANLAQ